MQPSPGKLSSAQWAEVLASVQQTLARAIESAQRREQALALVPPAEGPPAWRQELARIQERCAGLARSTDAGAKVAEADAALAESEAALDRWLAGAETARVKLAEWVGGAVG